MACVFEHLAVAFRQRNLDGPGLRPGGRIVNRELIGEGVRIETFEALGKFHVRAASPKRVLVREIRGLDDKRITLPMASRVALPQANVRWKMRTAVRWDDPDLVPHLDEYRNDARALHDLNIIVV